MPSMATTLHGIFAEAAVQHPGRTCLRLGDDPGLSYQQVHDASERCARHVAALGEEPGVVLLCADRSYGMLVAMLGTMRAGWAYCPVEPDFPPARVAAIVETAELTWCLTPAAQAPQPVIASFQELRTLAVHDSGHVEQAQGVLAAEAPERIPADVLDSSPAYVIFTSGSTGKPKGCVVPHRGSALYAHAVVKSCGLQEDMNFLFKTPYVFDVSIQDIYTAFAAGGTLIIAEPGVHKYASALSELVVKQQVNCMAFTPTLLVEFVNHLTKNLDEAEKVGRSLARILTIGEALMSATCKDLFQLLPELDGNLHNLYGPTEASVGVSHFCVSTASLGNSTVAPIGKPFDYVEFRIFDPALYEDKVLTPDLLVTASKGSVGELYLGGDCLAQGYMNNPEKTSSAFFDFPQVLQRSELAASPFTLYKTGDLVKCREDGVFEILGRNDFQVKIGGVRIECEEISAVLKTHPAVDDALVTVFEGPSGKALAAYVVCASSHDAFAWAGGQDASDVKSCTALMKQWITKTSLLAAMRPMVYIPLSSLPKNAAGKTDRHALPDARDLFSQLAGDDRECRHAVAHDFAKPHRALLGLRYILAILVACEHLSEGTSAPYWVRGGEDFSFCMVTFFAIGGFMLASSVSQPVSLSEIFRGKLLATHPLLLLTILYRVPGIFLQCPNKPEPAWEAWNCGVLWEGYPGTYAGKIAYGIVMNVFAQGAWPWGAWNSIAPMYGELWFSSAFYFCIICFPFFQRFLSFRCFLPGCAGFSSMQAAFFVLLWLSICGSFYLIFLVAPLPIKWLASKVEDPALKELLSPTYRYPGEDLFSSTYSGVAGDFAYSCPLIWALVFFLGMLTCHFFKAGHTEKESRQWKYWGVLTDATTGFLALSYFGPGVVATLIESSGAASMGESLAYYWAGGYPVKLVTTFACFWIYGLAKGQGFTAGVLGNRYLVTYFSPAAYSLYLFHEPTKMYYDIFRERVLGQASADANWIDSLLRGFIVLAFTNLLAVVVTHKFNASLTVGFLRCFDCVFSKCKPQQVDEDIPESTLQKVLVAVQGISGAEVDATTAIMDCGLDSFGVGVLVGVLRTRFPGLHLTALEVYRLSTLGDLVERIEACKSQGDAKGSSTSTPTSAGSAASASSLEETIADMV